MSHPSLRNYWYIFPAILLVILVTHKYGPGIDSDGSFYLFFGKSLSRRGDFLNYDNTFKGAWPPLFPAIIAFLSFLPFNIIYTLGVFNIFIYCGTLIMAEKCISWNLHNKKLIVPYMLILMVTFPFFSIFTKVWSDSLFVFLTTALLFFTIQYERENGKKYRFPILLCMAFLPIQRYPGLFCDLSVIGYFLIKYRFDVKAMKFVVLMLLASLLPFGLWMLRNILMIHNSVPYQMQINPFRLLSFGKDSMNEWILPHIIPGLIRTIIFDTLITITSVIILVRRDIFRKIGIMPVLFAGYTIAMTIVVRETGMEYRYLSPAIIPFLGSLIVIIDKIDMQPVKVFISLILLIMFFQQFITSTVFTAYHYKTGGGGYNSDAWQQSELVYYLKNNRLEDTVYTNDKGSFMYFNSKAASLFQPSYVRNEDSHITQMVAERGYLVFIGQENRNINAMNHFDLWPFNKLIKNKLPNPWLSNDTYAGLSRDSFLNAFAAVNHVSYSGTKIFKDGMICHFSKQNERNH